MSDQSYADASGVQIFHAGTASANLLPEFDLSGSGIIATLVGGANRYTVTAVELTVASTLGGSPEVGVYAGGPGDATGTLQATIAVPTGNAVGSCLRSVVGVDIEPGDCVFLRLVTAGTGDVVAARRRRDDPRRLRRLRVRVVDHPDHRERAPHDVPGRDGRREDDPPEEEHQACLHVTDHLERHRAEPTDAQKRRDVHEHRKETGHGEEGE